MQNGDRNAFASSAVPSLAEVAARIAAIDQISAARKAAIRSALNTASRWFKLPATAIPAHPEFLRRLFAGFSPAAVGATQKRVSNVKSDLLFAMRRLGLLARGSYLAPFAPEWQALWRRLPDQYARTTLSRCDAPPAGSNRATSLKSIVPPPSSLSSLSMTSCWKPLPTARQAAKTG